MCSPIIKQVRKAFALRERPMSYQLVGGVKDYQGNDGYRVLEHDPAQWD